MFWANVCGYSGQIMFAEWLTVSFNAAFTSFPCIFSFGFDQDVKNETAVVSPNLYKLGQTNTFFTRMTFMGWCIIAFIHGGICFGVDEISPKKCKHVEICIKIDQKLMNKHFCC